MKSRVQMWGHSLALRIPKSLAAATHMEPGTPVELLLQDGKLVVSPLHPATFTLAELVEGITPENRHGEVDTGPSVGAEAW